MSHIELLKDDEYGVVIMYNVFSFLKDSAEKYPQKIYVVDKEIEFTYSEVYQKVKTLAGHIAKSDMDRSIIDQKGLGRSNMNGSEKNKYCIDSFNINRGDRILIYLDNSVQYITAFFSALLLNAIVVPINKSTTVDNLNFIVQDTSPKVIISNTIFFKKIEDKVDLGTCRLINVDLIPKDSSSGNDNDNAYISIRDSDILSSGNSNSNDNASENHKVNLINKLTTDSNLPALILYTSGTTRMPKGVTLTHKNLIANTESILQYLELTCDDSILATINFSYSYGNSVFLTHTKAGGTIIIENRISYPVKIIEAMHQSKATGFSTVGSYINLLLKQESFNSYHLKYLRYITFAGESTSTQDIIKLNKMASHIKIFVMYGQTEASARLSYLEPSKIFEKAGSIGKGLSGVTLRVVKDYRSDVCLGEIEEIGESVKAGEVGEIIAYGLNIMKGYWNNDSETKAVIKNGWLYTGDLGTIDEEGYIYVKGRKDDIIKYLGHRISPLEIEAVINSCDQVLESAVVGIENGNGKQIKAFIIPKYSVNETDKIVDHIRKLLPTFKRPQLIEFVDEIPRTVNGKIKRSELRNING